ncbi:hypothetical protein Tco_1476826 [Tanacetum coccineum]
MLFSPMGAIVTFLIPLSTGKFDWERQLAFDLIILLIYELFSVRSEFQANHLASQQEANRKMQWLSSPSDPTNPKEDDSEIPPLEDIYQNSTDGIFTTSSYDDEGAVADFTNLETVVNVSPIPTSRIHSTHPKALILGDPTSAVQTRSKLLKSSWSSLLLLAMFKKQRRK